MKAIVWNKVGDIKLQNVDEPKMVEPDDAILRITHSAICGTDLHMVRGTMAGMEKGVILGHEAVGIVESIGPAVKDIKEGDRVVVCSTIACGKCAYCQREEYASCDKANPNGPDAGTAFFGGPSITGSFNGLQSERARIPFADVTLVRIPEEVSDEDALLTSDIFPTGYMGAVIGDVKKGDMVAVFGCGPVGQMSIASAKLLGASKVFAIDTCPDRLETARKQGAITIDYNEQCPISALKELTNGFGPDCCIDAVGVDAQAPEAGPAKAKMAESLSNKIEQKTVAPKTVMFGDQWRPGDAPSQVLKWCVEAVRKSGVVSIIGVYPENANFFPIGIAMGKSLTVRAANCSHRKYIPQLLKLIADGKFKPSDILPRKELLEDAEDSYKHFDKREPGWLKVHLIVDAAGSR